MIRTLDFYNIQKALFIFLSVIVCFVIENIFSGVFGWWFQPNILIILIVFFNLFRGIRYALVVAFFGGVLKDSFSVHPFGINIFCFVVCAYLTTMIKMSIYQVGSEASRVLLIFIITIINVLLQYILNIMFASVLFTEVFRYILIPEVLTTTVISPYIFEKFKQCALKLFA